MQLTSNFAEIEENELQQIDGGILPLIGIMGVVKVAGYIAVGLAAAGFAAGTYAALKD